MPVYSEHLIPTYISWLPSVGCVSSQSNQPVRIPNFVYPIFEIQPLPVASNVKVFAPVPVIVILVAPSVGLLVAPQLLKSAVVKAVLLGWSV